MARRPLFVRGNPEREAEYDELVEGVPAWIHHPVMQWLSDACANSTGAIDTDRVRDIAIYLRISLGDSDGWYLWEELRVAIQDDDDLILQSCDRALPWYGSRAHVLEDLLSRGGSSWRVGTDEDDQPCLESRVDETVTRTAREVMSNAGRAGEHLATAWHEAYGLDPSPDSAYLAAVKAVEVASRPVVTPNDQAATLGRVIGQMRSNPGRWGASLSPNDGTDPIDTVVHMLDLLWKSHHGRHGDPDENAPLNMSQEEAEAAVHLAVTLVQWFSSGAIAPAQ